MVGAEMRMNLSAMSIVLTAIGLQAGCSYLPTRESFSRFGLPSPKATIAASEKGEATSEAKPSAKTAKKSARSNDQTTIGMDIARGRTYEQSGNYDKARKVYEDLRKREPNCVAAAHRLGIVADLQKRHGEAEQLFQHALTLEPNNAEIMGDLGYCLFLQGKLEKSEEVLAQAVELAPTNTRVRNNHGLALGHLGKYEAALEEFAQAGGEADAYYNLAFVYAAQDRVSEAKDCFRLCLRLDPTNEQAHNALSSFSEYEQMSPEMRESVDIASEGVRYVPYQEVVSAGKEINAAVAQASGQANISTGRHAARSVHDLHQRSQGMLNRNMASNRPSAGNGAPPMDGQ